MHKLFTYFNDLCIAHGAQSFIKATKTLKNKLLEHFEELIDFHSISKYVIVHSSCVNPCEYSVAVLLGRGLQDQDHVRSYSNFIRRKLNDLDIPQITPFMPIDELIKSLDNGPIPDLYNTIYATKYGHSFKTNTHGYAITPSEHVANKIWSICCDWVAFVTSQPTSKQVLLSINIHRLTGSKESVTYLHKCESNRI